MEGTTSGRGHRISGGGRRRATDKFLVKLECRGPPPRSYGLQHLLFRAPPPSAAAVALAPLAPIGRTAGRPVIYSGVPASPLGTINRSESESVEYPVVCNQEPSRWQTLPRSRGLSLPLTYPVPVPFRQPDVIVIRDHSIRTHSSSRTPREHVHRE